jgi:sugar phosphate isomerase/epimerase
MDIGFSTSAGGDAWSLEECAAWASANDFDTVRLVNTGVADPDLILERGPNEITETLAEHGLYLSALSAHERDPNVLDDDPERAEVAAVRVRKSIEAASLLGAPIVVTNSGSASYRGWLAGRFYGTYSQPPGNPTDKRDELFGRFKKVFTPIAKFAEDKGVKIALDHAVRQGNIACNPEGWERALDAVPSDHLGLSCDPSHLLWLMITPIEDAIRAFAGKWYYADVKDAEIDRRMLFRQGVIGNWWWQYRVPGRGETNWGTTIGALLESGYDYVLCIENEDRGIPGLAGFALGCRHLRQFLPRRGEPYDPAETHD